MNEAFKLVCETKTQMRRYRSWLKVEISTLLEESVGSFVMYEAGVKVSLKYWFMKVEILMSYRR